MMDSRAPLTNPYTQAGIVLCIIGLFLRVVLSETLLEALGILYVSGGDGNAWVKIHSGAYCIGCGFVCWFLGRSQQHITDSLMRSLWLLLIFNTWIVFYWAFRDPAGIGFWLDTHWVMPMALLTMTALEPKAAYRVVHAFLVLGLINAGIGIGEGLTHVRLLPTPNDWVVDREAYFRASAFFGHPLNNAMISFVVLFVLLSMPWRGVIKGMATMLLMAALLAFGGRASFILALLGLGLWGLRQIIEAKSFATLTWFLLAGFLGGAGLALLMSLGLGERLLAFSHFGDDSAASRIVVFNIVDYIDYDEWLLGMSPDRMATLVHRVGLTHPLGDIENPWIVVTLLLGWPMALFWMGLFLTMMRRLVQRIARMHNSSQGFALFLALGGYVILASTSNSFGRKDGVFVVVFALVVTRLRQEWARVDGDAKKAL